MDKEIELAKSWFILAQIFITIAGFCIVTSGLSLSYKSSIIATSINAIGSATGNFSTSFQSPFPFENFFIPYGFMVFFLAGISFVIISITMWIMGNRKLKKLKT